MCSESSVATYERALSITALDRISLSRQRRAPRKDFVGFPYALLLSNAGGVRLVVGLRECDLCRGRGLVRCLAENLKFSGDCVYIFSFYTVTHSSMFALK